MATETLTDRLLAVVKQKGGTAPLAEVIRILWPGEELSDHDAWFRVYQKARRLQQQGVPIVVSRTKKGAYVFLGGDRFLKAKLEGIV